MSDSRSQEGGLPLVFVPAGAGAYEALRERAAGPMRVAVLFAFLAAISMMLGLMRWPSVHWELARAWATEDPSHHVVLAAIFDGLNRYLGNYIGEFLGELGFTCFSSSPASRCCGIRTRLGGSDGGASSPASRD